ncbi:MAG TPA: hypothetical protein VGI40_09625 [Pirellulaceae bacterium]|jgi:hypothetical protein
MKSAWLLAVLVAQATNLVSAAAYDLEMRVRLFSKEIVFGDPLYMEVTIVNGGKSSVIAPPPLFSSYKTQLNIEKLPARLITYAGPEGDVGGEAAVRPNNFKNFLIGDSTAMEYRPGEPHKHYWFFLLPSMHDLEFKRPFWKHLEEDETLAVWLSYNVEYTGRSPRLALLSAVQHIRINKRPDEEIKSLEKWFEGQDHKGKGDAPEMGPDPGDFRIFSSARNRKQTREFAEAVKIGELADLLQFTLLLQDVFHAAPEAKPAAEARFMAKLRAQPDIKRQALARQLFADTHNGLSRAAYEAIKVIAEVDW